MRLIHRRYKTVRIEQLNVRGWSEAGFGTVLSHDDLVYDDYLRLVKVHWPTGYFLDNSFRSALCLSAMDITERTKSGDTLSAHLTSMPSLSS